MLPAPPSSCAGWWFAQLWRAMLALTPTEYASWAIRYPDPGEVRLDLRGTGTLMERIAGSYLQGAERRCAVGWDWPGEDGMLHIMWVVWQPGEVIVRPLEWVRQRRPFPLLPGGVADVPWPLRVRITARGWHNQTLERGTIEASDGATAYPVEWAPPPGLPRLPRTDLPCALTTMHQPGMPRGAPDAPAIALAGLTLPWQIDLDREAWAPWRRLDGSALLASLGGPSGSCPRHGAACPWPATGRTR